MKDFKMAYDTIDCYDKAHNKIILKDVMKITHPYLYSDLEGTDLLQHLNEELSLFGWIEHRAETELVAISYAAGEFGHTIYKEELLNKIKELTK